MAPVCAQSATQHFLPPGPHPTDPLGRAPPHLVFSEGSPAGHTSPGLFLVQMNFSTMYVGELVVCFVGVGRCRRTASRKNAANVVRILADDPVAFDGTGAAQTGSTGISTTPTACCDHRVCQ